MSETSTGTALAAVAPEPKPQIMAGIDPATLVLITDTSHPKYGFLFDKRATEKADPNLVASMREEGFNSIIQAVNDPQFGLVVVAGRRRTLAAREAGVKAIVYAYPVNGVEDISLFTKKIRENTIRKSDDPFYKAENAQTLIDWKVAELRPVDPTTGEKVATWEPTARQVAEINKDVMQIFGYLPSHTGKFSELLSTLKFSNRVKKAVRRNVETDGKEGLSINAALAAGFHNMSPTRQDVKLDQLLAKGKSTVAEARASKTNTSVGEKFTSKEWLKLAETEACPTAQKNLILAVTNQIDKDAAVAQIPWVAAAQQELAEIDEKKAKQKEQEKAQKVAEREQKKLAKEQEKAAAKAAKSKGNGVVILPGSDEVMDL